MHEALLCGLLVLSLGVLFSSTSFEFAGCHKSTRGANLVKSKIPKL